jgi:hypothetical protein
MKERSTHVIFAAIKQLRIPTSRHTRIKCIRPKQYNYNRSLILNKLKIVFIVGYNLSSEHPSPFYHGYYHVNYTIFTFILASVFILGKFGKCGSLWFSCECLLLRHSYCLSDTENPAFMQARSVGYHSNIELISHRGNFKQGVRRQNAKLDSAITNKAKIQRCSQV